MAKEKENTQITRKSLSGLSGQALQDLLSEAVEKEKSRIAQIKDAGTLSNEEKSVIKQMEDYDNYLNELKYKLSDLVTFDGQEYQKPEVVDLIVKFISTQSVEFSSTLGLYQLVKFWKSQPTEVPYRTFDSTLRILNLCKYSGMEDWTGILVVNEFLSKNHQEYSSDLAWFLYLSAVHNVIMEQQKAMDEVATSAE